MKTIGHFSDLAAFVLDSIIIARAAVRRRILRNPPRLILIKLDQLGDFIAWLPMAIAIREGFSNYEITLIASRSWGGWATRFPYWDSVIVTDYHALRSSLRERWRVFDKVAHLAAEIAITFDRQIAVHDCIIRVSGATYRYGPTGNERRDGRRQVLTLSDRWYSHLVEVPSRKRGSIHEIQNQFAAGLHVIVRQSHSLIPEEAIERVQRCLSSSGYVVISPFSNAHLRDWPLDRFIRIARALSAKHNMLVVFTGTEAHAQPISEKLSSADFRALNLAGRTTLPQLAGIIAGAKLVVTNESGTLHLAYALQTPSVCVLGGGHFGQLVPYPPERVDDTQQHRSLWHELECFHCDWDCKFGKTSNPAPCVDLVSEERVRAACEEMLISESVPVADN